MLLTMADGAYQQPARSGTSRSHARRESDARRDLERMHLMTIRREKMRLQNEIDRVRINRKGTQKNNSQQLLSARFGMSSANTIGGGDKNWMMMSLNGSQRSVSPNSTPRRTRTARHAPSFDNDLPMIGLGPSPIKGELHMRRSKDEQRDPNTKLNELKKVEGRQKNLLSVKVNRFTRSLSPVSSRRSTSASPKLLEERQNLSASEMDLYDSRIEKRGSFPNGGAKHETRDSIAELDFLDSNVSVTKRVTTDNEDVDKVEHMGSRSDEALPQIPAVTNPTQLPRRPTVIRKESQVAILERNDIKKNKYGTNNYNSDDQALKKNLNKEITVATLGRDAKRVREILDNPQIVFDQEKYAPDGALRTVHMLPDADIAFGHARKARYLRWKDPDLTDYERELSISEIFGKAN